MSDLVHRVATRYAAVVIPFKPKPGVPTATIGGRKYVLSTFRGEGMDVSEKVDEGGPGTGHARYIHLPSNTPWRYLWVFDAEKKIVAMWQVSEGDLKIHGPSGHFASMIVHLEKKGQLNRVTHEEYHDLEKRMERVYDETVSGLKTFFEQNDSDFQKKVNAGVQEYYAKYVKPKVDRAISDVLNGAIPLGFKPYDSPHRSTQSQAIGYNVGMVLKRELDLAKVEEALVHMGINVHSPHEDNQATYWAIGDVKDTVLDRLSTEYA